MALLLPGMIVETAAVCHTTTQVGVNTMAMRIISNAGGVTTDLDLAADLSDWLADGYTQFMSVNSVYSGCRVQIKKPVEFVSVFSSTGSGPGSATGADLPTQVTGVITKQTVQAGRKYRGRIYPPFPATGLADGHGGLNATGIGLLTTLGNLWESYPPRALASLGVELRLCLIHTSDGSFTDIVKMFARSKFGTQRRRGQYGRPNIS